MIKRIPFTKEGYINLKNELEEIQTKRIDAVNELTVARDMGDRSENAAYKSARWKLSGIDRRIRQIKSLLKQAQIVDTKFKGFAEMGTKVTLTDGKEDKWYLLVGGYESDLSQNKLSVYSPIGKSLVGKKTGETVIVTVPAGMVAYKIKNVEAV